LRSRRRSIRRKQNSTARFDVLKDADEKFFSNREDAGAQAAKLEAESAEGAACDASKKLGLKFSKIAATNLDELCLKARYADVWDEIGESIISDLLAIGANAGASASKEAAFAIAP
jgi:hypothetical protein